MVMSNRELLLSVHEVSRVSFASPQRLKRWQDELLSQDQDLAQFLLTSIPIHPQERRMDTVLAQERVFLELADLVANVEGCFAYPLFGLWLCIQASKLFLFPTLKSVENDKQSILDCE